MQTQESSILAINGGQPTVTRIPERPLRWGAAESAQLEEMLQQPSLFYWNGHQAKLLVERFQAHYPLEYVMPCSSGTAALHIAVLAAGIAPGDEVIVPPISDMGTYTGILYQGGVPIFADVDPNTYNLDPADVARKVTPRTKTVIAVHLAGNPCDMDGLLAICREHNLILIEDCAQAWGAEYKGRPVGTIGDIGCWSLNDFKHIGCGDGGIVATNHPQFGPLLQRSGDKAYARGQSRFPEFLAPNYRISEPQSAIAAAQMERMPFFSGRRGSLGRKLSETIQGVTGVIPPKVRLEDNWTCWFYMFRIDSGRLSCDAATFAKALTAEGVAAGAGYIQAPVYQFPVFQNHNFFDGRWPIRDQGLTQVNYQETHCPVAEEVLATSIIVPINEGLDEEWIESVGEAITKVAAHYTGIEGTL